MFAYDYLCIEHREIIFLYMLRGHGLVADSIYVLPSWDNRHWCLSLVHALTVMRGQNLSLHWLSEDGLHLLTPSDKYAKHKGLQELIAWLDIKKIFKIANVYFVRRTFHLLIFRLLIYTTSISIIMIAPYFRRVQRWYFDETKTVLYWEIRSSIREKRREKRGKIVMWAMYL